MYLNDEGGRCRRKGRPSPSLGNPLRRHSPSRSSRRALSLNPPPSPELHRVVHRGVWHCTGRGSVVRTTAVCRCGSEHVGGHCSEIAISEGSRSQSQPEIAISEGDRNLEPRSQSRYTQRRGVCLRWESGQSDPKAYQDAYVQAYESSPSTTTRYST